MTMCAVVYFIVKMLYVCYVFEDFKHMLNVGRNLDKLVINERVSRFSKKRVYTM